MRPLSPSTWGHPPHVEGMWPGAVQERGGPHSVPPSFLRPARLTCSDKGLVWIFRGTPRHFFFQFGVEFPLKSTPDLKGLEWIFAGNRTSFFFLVFTAGFPLISIPDLKGLVI
jgi:hypothetical protein